MINVDQAFQKGKALILFITAGDPDLETTEDILCTLAEQGADLLEIGIPFSDPVAEGPVIQRASARALQGGVTTDAIFAMVRRVRARTRVPLAFMTYANVIVTYGAQRFMAACEALEVGAVIVPDLPYEEKLELQPACDAHGVALISLIAPTSEQRIAMIAREAQGFVYCVSSMGVTGVRNRLDANVGEMVRKVKAVRDIPCAVGFGISTPEQAQAMAQLADGVIVGSAAVALIEQYGKDCLEPLAQYVRALKRAL